MEKMELMDELQVHYKDFVKRMKGRVSYDDYETQSLLEGYTEELASFISKELDKAREEGRKNGKPMQGWECPKCGSVYSPLTFECPLCKGSGIKARTSSTTSGYDNSSYLN